MTMRDAGLADTAAGTRHRVDRTSPLRLVVEFVRRDSLNCEPSAHSRDEGRDKQSRKSHKKRQLEKARVQIK